MTSTLRIGIILALVAAVIGGAFWFMQNVPGKADLSEIRPTLRAKNLAIGHLENDEQAKAYGPLREVIQRVPEAVFGPQNLAVAGIMELEKLDPNEDAAARAKAAKAASEGLARLSDLEPERALRFYLQGLASQALGQWTDAYAEFLEAAHRVELSEGETLPAAAAWFAAYSVAKDRGLDLKPEEVTGLLESALDEQPGNLFLLTELLPIIAEQKPEEISEYVAAAQEAIEPLRAGIVKRLGIRRDPSALLEKAETFAASAATKQKTGDKSGADRDAKMMIGQLFAFRNVMRAEAITKSDRRRVVPNPLEFVKLDFNPSIYERYAISANDEAPRVFEFSDDWSQSNVGLVAAETEFASLSGGDLDLDGSLDVVGVHLDAEANATRLVCLTASDENGFGDEVATLAGVFEHARFVDLDNDFGDNEPAAIDPAAGESPCRTTDLDLIAYGRSGLVVWRNEAGENGRQFVSIEDDSFRALENIADVAVVDAEADGDLDLFVVSDAGVDLFLNRGDATFESTDEMVVGPEQLGPVERLIPVDLDRDVDIDVLVLRASDPVVGYFENLRHGRYRYRALPVAVGPGEAAVDLELLDADGNASWDLLVTTSSGGLLLRSETPSPGRWSLNETISVPLSGQVVLGDLDNDGLVDAALAGGLVSEGLLQAPWFADPTLAAGRTAAKADPQFVRDVDADGRLDLVDLVEGTARLQRNVTGDVGAHAAVTLLAQKIDKSQVDASGRVNSYGFGSTLEARSGERFSARVVDSQTTHFGLGSELRPDTLRVAWTNGIPSQIIEPEVNSYICEKQVLKGSCPYLYTWDGEKFAFVTDLLWAAPVGLQFADGVQAVPREWEHLVVPGSSVAERDGCYEFRITEELWEAAYFDHVQLTAVDHPIGTEVCTNEKVGPPHVAEPRLYVFGDAMPPRRVTSHFADGDVRLLTEELAAADLRFGRPYRTQHRQGLVETHQLEIAFDPVSFGSEVTSDERQLTLLLTGWLRPTDTSINVALSHDPRFEAPMPPRLLALRDGQWTVVNEFVGFPGGKTKTIMIDVTDAVDATDPVLRLETSMEFNWDRVALVAGSANGRHVETPCDVVSAELRERGFSRRLSEQAGGPESYDYAVVNPEPIWPLMNGRFTRLGDVRELLASADDQLVVIGSGDEIAIRFRAPPPPQAGFQRDFVLTSIGWDKDADLNTIYGDSSEPYPTLGVENYPEFEEFETRRDAAWQTRRFVRDR